MTPDIAIINGHIVDPAAQKNGPGNVYIKGERILHESDGEKTKAKYSIDASGCLVFPGLIDLHAHVFDRGTESGVPHACVFPPSGVSTIVDAGSAGSANFQEFYHSVIAPSNLRVKSLLNMSPAGLTTRKHHENLDPACYDEPRMEELITKYAGTIVGLKTRISKGIVGNLGLKPLESAVKFGDKTGLPVVVHVTDPVAPLDDVAALLRPGDILCHMYQGHGFTMLDADGNVSRGMWKARERGVVFDAANGQGHFSLPLARKCLEQGFCPDIISTDLSTLTQIKEPVLGLAYILSKYLNLGLDEMALAKASASEPARWLGLEGQIGTLAPGAFADVCILRKIEKRVKFTDTFGESFYGTQMLIPQLTMCGGQMLFRQMDFVAS